MHAKTLREYTVKELCRLFGVTKQAYYKYDEQAVMVRIAQEDFVVEFIHNVREKDPGIGGLKLWYMYQKAFGDNNSVGRDRFADIVDRNGLKVRLKVRKPRTTDSTHGLPVYPNLVRDFIPDAPNRLWVSDITYITVWRDNCTYTFCYLSLILDGYTEEIVGWSVGPTLDASYPIAALSKAMERIEGQGDVELIHHSDRGCQYASLQYVAILKNTGIGISMTENGDPKENAQAERINSTMKNELLKGLVFHSVEEVRAAVSKAVDFYNKERPHMSIDMMTPHEAASCSGEITKRWTSYRQEAIKNRAEILEIPEKGVPLHFLKGVSLRATPEGRPLSGITNNE